MAKKVYRLRWRFEYSDGKPDKWGIWNHDEECSPYGATLTDKTNLLFAHIEAEPIDGSEETKKVVTCAGPDLRHVGIVMTARVSDDLQYQQRFFVGLKLTTTKEQVTAYVDGTAHVTALSE